MNVTAVIINYNGASWLSPCLDSLLSQTRPPDQIMVVDNNSSDDSSAVLEKYSSKIRMIQTGKNLGFAGGANRAIGVTRTDYLLLMNPDVSLTPSFLEKLMESAESHPEGGSFSGKLLRFPVAAGPAVIDSTGHTFFRNRWVINRGEGEKDEGQFEDAGEIFGVCGAAALYRRNMLEAVRVNGEYLDEDFFLYLEDVDLDWRARLKGWKAYYVPSAVGYHQRGYLNVFRSQNATILRHCLKNRYLMIIKNDVFRDFLGDAWAILPLELMRFGKFLITAPRSLVGYWDVLRLFPRILGKRRIIQRDVRVGLQERRRWFRGSHSLGPIRNRLRLWLASPDLKEAE